MANIIKKGFRQDEPYTHEKLYNSIRAACLSVRTPVGEADITAKKICQHVVAWLTTKIEVTSLDLRLRAAYHLKTYNPDAAYMYTQAAGIIEARNL